MTRISSRRRANGDPDERLREGEDDERALGGDAMGNERLREEKTMNERSREEN